MPLSLLVVIAGALALAVGTVKLLRVGRRPAGYPPGPPTLPILGNLHLMPSRDPHLQFQKWAQEYGPVYSLILGTKTLIVLSSDKAVKDLLDKRSDIYSDRPDAYIAQDLIGGGMRVALMKYGPTWRMIRKMVHNILHVNAAKSYVPYQILENQRMLVNLLDTPDRFFDHIRRYANSLTTQMIYGFRTTDVDDPKLLRIFEVCDCTPPECGNAWAKMLMNCQQGVEKVSQAASLGTAALLDVYPILRYLPNICVPIRPYAKALHKSEHDLFVGNWMDAKNAIKNGTAKHSFCVNIIKAQEVSQFSDSLAGYIGGNLLEAGSETTADTLVGFVQAMLVFPDVQQRAQEEIDRVVGPDRLPTMADEPNLPYIRACVKETLRWMPTVPLGIPHAVIRDDAYMGYTIPKGAGVALNIWAIHMDPARHPSPRTFSPLRYIHDVQTAAAAALNPDPAARDHFGFGAGRRICPGMHIAERSLFIGIARMLWAFSMERATDREGRQVVPDIERFTQGLAMMPEPFEARFRVRGKGREEVVRREWREASGGLDERGQWRVVPKGMALGWGARD
ncbi:cytochrome p450 [Lasallia pustulata]|uniref:Cytochrome p450 n=1 Tax=Lasallia pustulata TaxID=136370 RepID=A0A1W5D7V3_9LECA|nr:cytochrome p450 [Lasallia pustulata]